MKVIRSQPDEFTGDTTNFTQGPWKCGPSKGDPSNNDKLVYAESETKVMTICRLYDGNNHDAFLISKAPEMLAMLEDFDPAFMKEIDAFDAWLNRYRALMDSLHGKEG